MIRARNVAPIAAALGLAALPCCDPAPPCGPARGFVERVVDGDTILLAGGERVRYLGVDAPESTGPGEDQCFGPEASAWNSARVEGREVLLSYDVECRDRYDRLLAHVWADGTDVGLDAVTQGYGCAMVVPPNGEGRADFEAAEQAARAHGRGLWGACRPSLPCGD